MDRVKIFYSLVVISLLVSLTGCAGSSPNHLNFQPLAQNQYGPVRVELVPNNSHFDSSPGKQYWEEADSNRPHKYTPDLKYAIVGSLNITSEAFILDTDTGQYRRKLELPLNSREKKEFYIHSISSNSNYALVTWRSGKYPNTNHGFEVFDLSTGRRKIHANYTKSFAYPMFTPDGDHLMIKVTRPSRDQEKSRWVKNIFSFQLVEIATGKNIFYQEKISGRTLGSQEMNSVDTFSADGRYMYFRDYFYMKNKSTSANSKIGSNYFHAIYSLDLQTGEIGTFPYEIVLINMFPQYYMKPDPSVIGSGFQMYLRNFIVRDDGKLIMLLQGPKERGSMMIANFNMATQEIIYFFEIETKEARDGVLDEFYLSHDGRYAFYRGAIFDLNEGKSVAIKKYNPNKITPAEYFDYLDDGSHIAISHDGQFAVYIDKPATRITNNIVEELIRKQDSGLLNKYLNDQVKLNKENIQHYSASYKLRSDWIRKLVAEREAREERQGQERMSEILNALGESLTLGIATGMAINEMDKAQANQNQSSSGSGKNVKYACAYNYPADVCRRKGNRCVPKSQCDPATSVYAERTPNNSCNCTSGKTTSGSKPSTANCNGVWKGAPSGVGIQGKWSYDQAQSHCEAACKAQQYGKGGQYSYNCNILRDWGLVGSCTVCN